MTSITTHILDTTRGRPAAGVLVVLEFGPDHRELARGSTDPNGRLGTLLPPDHALALGVYRLTFHTGPYFAQQGVQGFYPQVLVDFEVREPSQHYHVPLLLNPYGYSTYRGS